MQFFIDEAKTLFCQMEKPSLCESACEVYIWVRGVYMCISVCFLQHIQGCWVSMHGRYICEDIPSCNFPSPTHNSKFLFLCEFRKDYRHKSEDFFFLKKESYFIVYKILEVHYMFNTSKNKKLPHSKIEWNLRGSNKIKTGINFISNY